MAAVVESSRTLVIDENWPVSSEEVDTGRMKAETPNELRGIPASMGGKDAPMFLTSL